MILVTGATGLNGTALVRKLSAKGVPLRALVRSAAKAAEIAALPNVEIAIADMAKPETLPAALAGVDRAMLNSSADPAMVEVQSNFIDAGCQSRGQACRQTVRHHAGARFAVPLRAHARRNREAAGGVRHGVHPSARRRVHAELFSAGPDDPREGRAVLADGEREDRLDRYRRPRRNRGARSDESRTRGKNLPTDRSRGPHHDGGRREALRRHRQDDQIHQCSSRGR